MAVIRAGPRVVVTAFRVGAARVGKRQAERCGQHKGKKHLIHDGYY